MKIKVAELFAGVGGFREAIEYDTVLKNSFTVAWSNQWEPAESKKPGNLQSANRVYIEKFGSDSHNTSDIHLITESENPLPAELGDIQMLVGGFPCQDYSVAKPKNSSKGLRGPKGILWWSIERILRDRKPDYILLENVDRLINSPSSNRGRDFAVILKGLESMKYIVEWRVVNAADYGFAQKRRRIFICAYSKTRLTKLSKKGATVDSILTTHGVLAKSLPCNLKSDITCFDLSEYLSDDEVASKYRALEGNSPFKAAGIVMNGKAWTCEINPERQKHESTLRDIITTAASAKQSITDEFRIEKSSIPKWSYAKGRKNEPRRKSEAVINFILSKIGKGICDKKELKKYAKDLPYILDMDLSFNFSFDSRDVKISLAREELNLKIANALGVKPQKINRPVVLTRAEINHALKESELRAKIEESMTSIAVDRAISLLGIKDKDSAQRIFESLLPIVKEKIKFLAFNKKVEIKIGTKIYSFNKDELANNSFAYGYKEGGLPFPDPLDSPGRTIITSEGGSSVSRFKHVICEICAANKTDHKDARDCVKAGKLRRLLPEELERMNGFSVTHSNICSRLGISNSKRAFFMGNALVIGVVQKIMRNLL